MQPCRIFYGGKVTFFMGWSRGILKGVHLKGESDVAALYFLNFKNWKK